MSQSPSSSTRDMYNTDIYEQDMYNTAVHGVRDNCTQMDYSCSGPSQRYLKIWKKSIYMMTITGPGTTPSIWITAVRVPCRITYFYNIQIRCVGFRCLRILKDRRCPRALPAVPEICTYRIYEQDMYNTAAHGVRGNCTQMDYSCSGPSQRYLRHGKKYIHDDCHGSRHYLIHMDYGCPGSLQKYLLLPIILGGIYKY